MNRRQRIGGIFLRVSSGGRRPCCKMKRQPSAPPRQGLNLRGRQYRPARQHRRVWLAPALCRPTRSRVSGPRSDSSRIGFPRRCHEQQHSKRLGPLAGRQLRLLRHMCLNPRSAELSTSTIRAPVDPPRAVPWCKSSISLGAFRTRRAYLDKVTGSTPSLLS